MKYIAYSILIIWIFASCNNASTSNTATNTDSTATRVERKAEKNMATVKKGFDQFPTHDAHKVWTDATPDLLEAFDGNMPPVKGDSAVNALTDFFRAFPDVKVENQLYFGDDHNVAVLSDYSGTFQNDMGPIKATGKAVKWKDVDLFTLNDDGKITSHRHIYPAGALFMQAGADMSKMMPKGDEKKKM